MYRYIQGYNAASHWSEVHILSMVDPSLPVAYELQREEPHIRCMCFSPIKLYQN